MRLTTREHASEPVFKNRMEATFAHNFLAKLPTLTHFNKKINAILKTSSIAKSAVFIIHLDDDSNSSRFASCDFNKLLLRQAAAIRIMSELGLKDILACRNENEFVILLYDVDSIQKATDVAQKILETLNNAFIINMIPHYITTSIGISIHPYTTKHAATLLNNTSIALYHAQEMGENNYQIFTKKMASNAHLTKKREDYLHDALQKNELSISYQPIFNTKMVRPIAIESLLRWNHPKLGAVLPCDFIPLAEKTGLILTIGDWVLQSSCLQAKQWQTEDKPIKICVNLSPRQFQNRYDQRDTHLITSIEKALEKSNLAPDLLELEITESIMIKNPTDSINTIKKLKKLGVRIACDDFGTGYCALNYLKYFPLDTIKIDKSFIDGITNNAVDLAIIRAIILLAKQLNIDVVAEGVECNEQINLLKEIGCEIIQGYYYSKPVQSDKIDSILGNS
jgi:predicted signal transduction protein with EAL and GGDEF domain